MSKGFSSFNLEEEAKPKIHLCKWSRKAGIHALFWPQAMVPLGPGPGPGPSPSPGPGSGSGT